MPDSRSNIFEGRTLEEAVNKGLSALRLSRAEAMITVMQEGSSGFLGFGSRPFRVRMAARPGGAIREEETREPRRVRGDRGGRPERGGRGGRGGPDRGGRGGREGGGRDRGGERTGGERPARAGGPGGPGGPGGRGGPRERPAEVRGRGPQQERREEPVAQSGDERVEQPARGVGGAPRGGPRGGDRERGGRGRRGRRGPGPRMDRPQRNDDAPMPAGDEPERHDDRQPGFGMRGFEDRRRPGDRREESGLPPSGGPERRTGDERRNELEGAQSDDANGEGRRRRRGRRGGRRRHRGEEGAAPEVMSAREPMPAMGTGDDFAPVDDTDAPETSHEPEMYEASDRIDSPRRRGGESERRREPSGEPTMSGEQLQATTRQVTEELMRAMGFDATVTVTPEDEEKVSVTVQVSEGEEFLTGRKGETRQALQHLINRMVNRGEGSRYHVQLEVNDFWAHRETELEQQARQMADDAVSTGNEQVTDYLNAQERRIIHVTLREDSRVRTYAIGDGMIKRLAVAPAQFAETTEPGE